MATDRAAIEIDCGRRFAFGSNWRKFVITVDESRIRMAEQSLQRMLNTVDLRGQSFLDVGSGSGLFSLAAVRLGAGVTSFDYDGESVMATRDLSQRFTAGDEHWTILHGSILDRDFLAGLGEFDVVYSWGVLHHTGRMWDAMGNVIPLVKVGGRLFISIYNDQGKRSVRWRAIKQRYVSSRQLGRLGILSAAWVYLYGRGYVARAARRVLRGKGSETVGKPRPRGMSPWRDLIDWVGGYPFEVATPEAVFSFYRERGFVLDAMVTRQGLGCNEFVFTRRDQRRSTLLIGESGAK